jgi:hypothetical protein
VTFLTSPAAQDERVFPGGLVGFRILYVCA